MKVVIIQETLKDIKIFRKTLESTMESIKNQAELNQCIVQPLLLQQTMNETYIVETIIYDLIPLSALNQRILKPQ